ncbi:MAG: response regulator [Desulfomonilaceae bacterium]
MSDSDVPKILIVDDQPFSLKGASRIMAGAGYQTLEADNGTDCLKLAAEHKPDMILLDVVMPDIDGREVCRRIKSNPQTRDIYVILLSSTEIASDDQANALEHYADGYIARPVRNRELVARVKSLMRLKETEKRLAEALEFNKKILATSSVGIATYASDGHTTFANEALASIFGGSVSEVTKENFRELESWRISGLLEDAQETLSSAAEKIRQVHVVTKYGKEVWLDCHLHRFTSGAEYNLLLTVNDITSIKTAEEENRKLIEELQKALAEVKTLSGFLPICSSCKKIRNDKGYWEQIESYIRDHSEAQFTHGICPECARKLYPEFFKDK